MVDNYQVEIIQLAPSDWQSYRQIRLEALQESPQAFGSTFQDRAAEPDTYWISRLEEAAKGKHSWLLFARSEGHLVGLMGAFRLDAYEPPAPDQALIVQVYVSPLARGSGVAGRLMEALLNILKENGVRVARLDVSETQEAAMHLYQRFGFKIAGSERRLLGDGLYHLEYMMEKVL